MIVAAGLTAAWQHTLIFDAFHPGQVNRAREVHWCGAGKAINVGIALSLLGGLQSTIVSVLGGAAREPIERELDELDVATRWITSAAPTRTCTTIVDATTGIATELVENAGALSASELAEAQRVIIIEAEEADVVVLTGSLPAGAPSTFYRDVLGQIKCRAVLDVRGQELLTALDQKPFLVKPNREELAQTVGRSLDSDDELRKAMQELHQRGAQWIVVTDGRRAIWISDSQRFYRIVPPAVEKVINPIGCGDAMAAGIAWALREGREPLEAIRFGAAAAADNVSRLLPARVNAARVAQILPSVAAEPI